jgi:LmbE family N-acetylglucosaminyl deacetylase
LVHFYPIHASPRERYPFPAEFTHRRMRNGLWRLSHELTSRQVWNLCVSTLSEIFDGHYVLLLAVRPGDETRDCGGFIAESCARGRPPFVCIVTDGSREPNHRLGNRSPGEIAQARADQTRVATAQLGLPDERLVLFGLYDGSVPQSGARFARLVDAVADIARRYDCSTVCAPLRPDSAGDHLAVQTLARALAAQADLRLIWQGAVPAALHLDVSAWAAQKRQAVQTVAGTLAPAEAVGPFELFLPAIGDFSAKPVAI